MPFDEWQLHLLGLLEGGDLDIIPLKDIDSVLVFLNKFDSIEDLFAEECAKRCGNDSKAKERILKLVDRTLLENEHDVFRIYGRAAFSDKSRKTLKTRYQRLCRIFHPDHGLSELQFLNQRMSIINSSFDLAEKNFNNPSAVYNKSSSVYNKTAKTKDFKTTDATSFANRSKHNRRHSLKLRRRSHHKRKVFFKTWRRINRKFIRGLYRIDTYFRNLNRWSKRTLKVMAGLLAVMLSITVYQFVQSSGNQTVYEVNALVNDVEKEPTNVVSQPYEKELQVSEIERILDEMLAENSTKDIDQTRYDNRDNQLSQTIDSDISMESAVKHDNEDIKVDFIEEKDVSKAPRQTRPVKKSEKEVVKIERVSQPVTALHKKDDFEKAKDTHQAEIAKNVPIILPKSAENTLRLFGHFYAESQIESLASLFTADGSFFEFSGKRNIENSTQRLFEKIQNQTIQLKVHDAKEAGPWLILDSEIISVFQLKETQDWVRKHEKAEIVLFADQENKFKISSLSKK